MKSTPRPEVRERLTDEQIDDEFVASCAAESADRCWYIDGATISKADVRAFARNLLETEAAPSPAEPPSEAAQDQIRRGLELAKECTARYANAANWHALEAHLLRMTQTIPNGGWAAEAAAKPASDPNPLIWAHRLVQAIGSRLGMLAGSDLSRELLPALEARLATPNPAPAQRHSGLNRHPDPAPPLGSADVREALRELVACKDYKDTGLGMSLDDYLSRKPLAWENARAALAEQASPDSLDHPTEGNSTAMLRPAGSDETPRGGDA